MRITILHIVAFTLLPACWADDIKPFDLKAGLWERTVTTEAQYSAETLAKMPPAERARVDAMRRTGSECQGRSRFASSARHWISRFLSPVATAPPKWLVPPLRGRRSTWIAKTG